LDFEKQTLIAVFPKDRDEVRVLLVYEGMHARGKEADNLKEAKEDLSGLLQDNKLFYLGEPLLKIDLAPKKEARLSPSETKWLDLAKKHITTKAGVFNLSKDGKLALTQFLTIREVSKFITAANGLISEDFGRMAEDFSKPDAKGEKRRPRSPWDEESLKRMQ